VTVAYLKACMTCALQFEMMLRGTEFQYGSEQLIGVLLTLLFFSAPFLCYKLLHGMRDKLNKVGIKDTMYSLYTGIHLYRDLKNIDYMPVFLMRRFIFAFIPALFYNFPFLQLQLMIGISSVYMSMYMSIRPHEDPWRVRLEVLNEGVILMLNYHMALFSEFTLSDATAYYMGYSYLGFVALVLLANFYLLAHKILTRIKSKNLLLEKRRLYWLHRKNKTIDKPSVPIRMIQPLIL
jgi:hypothetical protein